ncbi:MAG TPA: DsrE family protein [Thiobacillaceae bacterium]|nr:DsrE family protein [Thiobacillaceae bacterium]
MTALAFPHPSAIRSLAGAAPCMRLAIQAAGAAGLLLAATLPIGPAFASEAPWGKARAVEQQYAHQKVVYDVAVDNEATMQLIISRAMLLADFNGSDPFDSKVVIVLHGDEIPFFAIKNYPRYRELMQRAQGATLSGVIEFRMCRLAAQDKGFAPEDFHGFITVVPMADTEIVRLQQAGYAYMR